jgi:hypothetical protein
MTCVPLPLLQSLTGLTTTHYAGQVRMLHCAKVRRRTSTGHFMLRRP